tara:strand:+ start:367 stop:1362 length:996 start_codon:yes stop_codon:yes gene_type:complete
MPKSARVLGGSLTKGSKALDIRVEGEQSSQQYQGRQIYSTGHTTKDIEQNGMFLSSLIKSNASEAVLVGTKRIESEDPFNDMISNRSPTDSDLPHFGVNKISQVMNHRIERRDLGMTSFLAEDDDEFYKEHVDPTSPVEIIQKNPEEIFLPLTMVDFSSIISRDGVIDPLDMRNKVIVSLIEVPFSIRGIRGSFEIEDPFRNNSRIQEGTQVQIHPASQVGVLEELRVGPVSGSVPFLDAPEFFGPIELPSVFQEDHLKIRPFTDTNSYQEVYFVKQEKKGVSISNDMRSAILKTTAFDTEDAETFDLYGRRGRDYFGTHTDSIVFGGLLK